MTRRRKGWLARRRTGPRSRGMRVQEHRVPCNGCVECCIGDMIFIHPEMGDRASDYETELYGGRYVLAHRPDGACVYLTPTGCGIHSRRPAVCRELDCRIFLDLPPGQLRDMLARGMVQHRVVAAARRLRAADETNARREHNDEGMDE